MRVSKIDDDKRIVTAIASVVSDETGSTIRDFDGDEISIDELEYAFIRSFAKGGDSMGGEMHERVGGAHVVQHFTLSRPEWAGLGELMGVPEMSRAWEIGLVKFFVEDDDLWQRVKGGDLPEISLAGTATAEGL